MIVFFDVLALKICWDNEKGNRVPCMGGWRHLKLVSHSYNSIEGYLLEG